MHTYCMSDFKFFGERYTNNMVWTLDNMAFGLSNIGICNNLRMNNFFFNLFLIKFSGLEDCGLGD